MIIRFLLLLLFVTTQLPVVASEANPAAQEQLSEVQQQSQSTGEAIPTSGTQQNHSPQNTAEPETIDLETAYKREYAFLAAQKKELTERLKRFKANAAQEERTLNDRVNSLEQESVERSVEIDQLNEQLADAERQETALDERNDALEITYSQAMATLENHGVKIPSAFTETQGKDPAKVSFLFRQALTLIDSLGKVKTQPGEFFLEDGKQTTGNIIHVGNIAAYGISADGSGSLVPAGEGNFKIWKEPTADIAQALSNNQQPDILKLFLFESRTQAIEENPDKSLIAEIESGGVIAWIIIFLGASAALLILLRVYLLYKNSINTKQLSSNIIQHVATGRLDEAKNHCNTESSAIARVLATTLSHLRDDREHMDSVVHESILLESSALDRFGAAILVIASVSPLLGLLGTVTGMISTFDVITEFGTGDPKLLSGGISIALVTTKLGLAVAIPALLLGSLLSAWARNIKRDMEHAALSVTNAFFDRSSSNDSPPTVNGEALALNN